MAMTAEQLATTLGFTALLSVGVFLSVAAYWALRKMDDVVLRARMYMNRRRLFSGFLSLALGMITMFAVVLGSLGYNAVADAPLPSAAGLSAFVLFFLFLSWALYNFWALGRTPRSMGAPKAE